jgi:hypothetical protein
MAEAKQSARVEEPQQSYWWGGWDDLGWDDLEDGITVSRRAVFAPTLHAEALAQARPAPVEEPAPQVLRRAIPA